MEEGKKKSKKILIIVIILVLLIIVGVVIGLLYMNGKRVNIVTGKIDDWVYSRENIAETEASLQGGIMNPGSFTGASVTDSVSGASSSSSSSSNIGFSTGGAKDVNNFRENIEEGYFPISTDITYNGLFYDYTFDTGNTGNNSQDLFSPSYSTAISKDPVSGKDEYYMTVGLNSNIKESDFSRKKLNLVVVLDISGSMISGFDSYYYDDMGENSEDESKTKMQIANESVNVLLDQLNEDDRFGMVLFDDEAYLAKPINLVETTDIEAIKGHILEIEAQGGTNFESGYEEATKLLDEYKNVDTNEYENRIIVITDAMPNYGETSDEGLLSYVKNNADNGIYTTFIGVGVDFNTELTEAISNVRGANYYSVHNSSEFKDRMGEQFEYMVTPLVFDLELSLNSDVYEIVEVYGSDTVNKESGSIMNVNTLFPSKTTSDGEVKGGVVLLKLSSKNENSDDINEDITLNVSYKDREGKEYQNSQTVSFTNNQEYYDNTGIRKAILLTRYANTLKDWILYERSDEDRRFLISPDTGIEDCLYTKDEIYLILGRNERTSVDLEVSDEYKEIFSNLKTYMEQEINEIQDNTLNQEIEILDKLINYNR